MESELCYTCRGSGEGYTDGSKCFVCKGSGAEPIYDEDQDECREPDE